MPRETAERLASVTTRPREHAPRKSVSEPAPLPPPATPQTAAGELRQAIEASKRAFLAIGKFSFAINILMLAGPLFMLQVYDRVMASGSMSTLAALSLLTAAVYGVIGLLELIRTRIIVRTGIDLDRRIGDRVFEATIRRALQAPGSAPQALRDLDQLRQFVSGPAPIMFFDAPWTPIYLVVIFLLHWTLGLAAVAGAAGLILLAWIGDVRTRALLGDATKAGARSLEVAETGHRNAEAIAAMGMLTAYRARWQETASEAMSLQRLAADRLGDTTAVTKTLRLLLQSLLLAIGAALAIGGTISAGSIVAATIIFGRALAPVEQALAHWRGFGRAREAYEKLDALLAAFPSHPPRTAMPAPKGLLELVNVRVASPDTRTVILSGISFSVEPGKMVAVIGPSASGKSTLARAIVGLWQPFGGQIKLDGARLDQWNPEELGQHIGYLPQDVELFAGTVRENIARFRTDAKDEDVVAAAKAAHAHELIMALPQGYETGLGAFGTHLSAGQRQRIGLARALFRNPSLVVLDEPNANLDRNGDEALSAAVDGMRERGQTVVLVSHRVQVIGKADYLLYVDKGLQKAFGPRGEVIRQLQGGGEPAPAEQQPQRPSGRTRPTPSEQQPKS